jgi:hypothetical protein
MMLFMEPFLAIICGMHFLSKVKYLCYIMEEGLERKKRYHAIDHLFQPIRLTAQTTIVQMSNAIRCTTNNKCIFTL